MNDFRKTLKSASPKDEIDINRFLDGMVLTGLKILCLMGTSKIQQERIVLRTCADLPMKSAKDMFKEMLLLR